jgi:hypothetical protein
MDTLGTGQYHQLHKPGTIHHKLFDATSTGQYQLLESTKTGKHLLAI